MDKKAEGKIPESAAQTKREYVSGESHYFLGNRYRLNVMQTDESPKVEIKRKKHIDLHIKQGTSTEKRERILDNFYRSELRKQIPVFLDKWQERTGIKVNEIYIKKMKTKWGSSNPENRRIWLNLELAKNPLYCLEYVLVHEMTHLLEKNHTDRFFGLMDSFMPQWEQYRDELNNSVLGFFMWEH